jgi:hypothetical protein
MSNCSSSVTADLLAGVVIYGELLDVLLHYLIPEAPAPSLSLSLSLSLSQRYVIQGVDLNVQNTKETKENIVQFMKPRIL